MKRFVSILMIVAMLISMASCKGKDGEKVDASEAKSGQSQQTENDINVIDGSTDDVTEVIYETGDIITYGCYEQDNDSSNGAEPIEWLVLANEGDRALVISKYGLDCKPYNETEDSAKWADSSLREWLNNRFLVTAFNADEQKYIGTSHPVNSGAEDTEDRIFLLSIEEAELYFKSSDDRACVVTAFAIERGVDARESTGTADWWLRSPGEEDDEVACVDYDGDIDDEGEDTDSRNAVRPAMWISYTEVSEPLTKAELGLSEVEYVYGDTVVLGSYEQDNDTSNGAEPIEWYVIKSEGKKVFVISKYALLTKKYDDYQGMGGEFTWESCTLRQWLNNDFLNSSFSAEEQSRIETTHLVNNDNPIYNIEGGNDTDDKIFLLSAEEAELIFYDNLLRCKPTACCGDTGTLGGVDTCHWWLRSPGEYSYYASYVGATGGIRQDGHNAHAHDPMAVRPAMWITVD